MLNVLRSIHALPISVMVAFNEMLSFLEKNPDEKVTPARQRTKDFTEELQNSAPIVRYEGSDAVMSTIARLFWLAARLENDGSLATREGAEQSGRAAHEPPDGVAHSVAGWQGWAAVWLAARRQPVNQRARRPEPNPADGWSP